MSRAVRILRFAAITLLVLALAGIPHAVSAPSDLLDGGYYTIATWPAGARVFAAPSGAAVDSAGNVYIADTRNHVIKKLSSAGQVLAEWGGKGSASGEFNEPASVAVGASGNVYVADTENNRIQVLDSSGEFVREWGNAGVGDGEFARPAGIALDASENVYVSDTWNGRVQKFTSTGSFTTSWGSTGPGDGQFDGPRGISVDPDGSVYIADVNNRRIQKFSGTGSYITQWGPIPDGTGGYTSRYVAPYGVHATSAGVFVADAGRHVIEKCSTSGAVQATWGAEGSGTGQFLGPEDVTVDATGTIYVADTRNNRIPVLNSSGVWQGAWDSGGSGDGELDGPEDVSLDATGGVYVADTDNHRVQRLTADGTFVVAMGSQGSGAGQLNTPGGVAVDATGTVFVADTGNDRIQTYDASGTTLGSFGSAATLSGPRGVAVDATGTVWVADSDNDRIRQYAADGTYLSGFGISGSSAGRLNDPRDVAVDATGTVWVCDTGNNRIQRFTSAGTYLGSWGSWGTGDGSFKVPEKIELGPDGDVYVADAGNDRIQRFTPEGEFRIAFGSVGAEVGQLRWPSGVAVDASDRVMVAERDNHRVQVLGHDDAPPTTTAYGVPAGWSASPVTVTLVATDDASGVETTYYRIDAGADTTYTAPFTVTAQGETTIRFWSVDRIGQVEPIDTDNIAVVRIDSVPPSGAMTLDGGAAYTQSTTVTAAMTYVDAVDMRFDTGSGYGIWESYAPSRQLPLSGEGTHTVLGQFRDALGNAATATSTIQVDHTPPTSAARGVSDDWVIGAVTVSIDASDTLSGVAATRYMIEGGAEETYTASFEIAVEGETDVSFYSLDRAGNIETSQTVTVKIDSIPPTGSMQVNGGVEYAASTVLSVESSVTGAAEMRLDVGSGFTAWAPYSAVATATGTGEGDTTVTAQYRDAALNVLELTDTIVVDLTAPVTTSDAQPAYTGSASIELTPTDALSGVMATYYKLDDAPWTQGTTIAVHTAGDHSLAFYSVDNVGNTEATQTVPFTNDSETLRRGGADRYAVAVGASSGNFASSGSVILATGSTYADALSAAGLAGCLEAPILLTPSDALPTSVEGEIARLGAAKAIIVGGTASVSPAIETRLRDGLGLDVERIGGRDRYAVSASIAEKVRTFGEDDGRVFIASGEVGADALSLSPVVYSAKSPLILTARDSVPAATEAALRAGTTSVTVLAGGPNTVTDANLARMAAMVGTPIERLEGRDRYAVAAAVARYSVAQGISSYSYMGVANGANDKFADSLCGGPAIGLHGGVMTLTLADTLPSATRGVFTDARDVTVQQQVFGGPASVSESVIGEIRAIIE